MLGRQIFGGTDTEEAGFGGDGGEEKPRQHFDYFFPAMLTVFMTFAGGWVDPFSAGASSVGIGLSAAYYVASMIVGFFIIGNVFVSILLESFAEDEE